MEKFKEKPKMPEGKEKFFSFENLSAQGVFNPSEEIEKIHQRLIGLSAEKQKELRKELIKDFKEKFVRQLQGISEMKNQLENFAEIFPNASKEMRSIINDGVKKYSLSPKQVEKFNQMIDSYLEKHRKIQKLVSDYKKIYQGNWKKEFFKDLFGAYPKGQIKLEVGPVYLVWYCYDVDDFCKFYGVNNFIPIISEGAEKGEARLGLACMMAGINVWLIESRGPDKGRILEVRNHEVQHIIYDLEKPILFPVKEKLNYFQKLKNHSQERIKHEILAFLKAKEEFEEIKKLLIGSIYDFYSVRIRGLKRKGLLEKLQNRLFNQLSKEVQEKFSSSEEWFNSEIEKEKLIFKNVFDKAVSAAEEISKIQPFDKRENIVHLLTLEPLNKWPRLARILKETEDYDSPRPFSN